MVVWKSFKRNCTNPKVRIEKMGCASFEMESWEASDTIFQIYEFYINSTREIVPIWRWELRKRGMCHLKWNLMRRETLHTIFSLKWLPDRMIWFAAGPRAGWDLARCPTSCLTRQKYIQWICRWCVGDVVEQVVWHVTEYRVTVDMGCWDFTT